MPDVYTWIVWAVGALALVAGSEFLGVTGLLAVLLLALIGLIALGFVSGQRTRRRDAQEDPRFEPTDEVFRDPSGGGVVRVPRRPQDRRAEVPELQMTRLPCSTSR